MKHWGAAAIVGGLVATVAGMSASPADARKKKKEPESYMTADPAFREAAATARASLDSGDLTGANTAISGLVPASPMEKYMAASLAMELAVKRGDVVAQRRTVAQLIESGAVPQGQMGHLNAIAGYLSYQTGANDNAAIYLGRALEMGDKNPKTALMLVETYVRLRKFNEAATLLDQTITAQKQANQPVPASWYDRAASFAYARKDWAAVSRYNAARLTETGPEPAEWRTVLTTYMGGASLDKEARLDLYRLQAATGGMASERDYQGYAQLAEEQGYPAEAKAIIEAGQSKGKLAGNDPVAAALIRKMGKKVTVNLASIRGLAGKSGSVASASKAASNGDDLLANSQYAEAAAYYHAALTKGGVDRDRVSTRLGIALARSGDLDGARQAFAPVGGQWAPVAAFWQAWIDGRGDAEKANATATPAASSNGAQAAQTKSPDGKSPAN